MADSTEGKKVEEFIDFIQEVSRYIEFVKVPTHVYNQMLWKLEHLARLEDTVAQLWESFEETQKNAFAIPLAMLVGHAIGTGDPETAQMWIDSGLVPSE